MNRELWLFWFSVWWKSLLASPAERDSWWWCCPTCRIRKQSLLWRTSTKSSRRGDRLPQHRISWTPCSGSRRASRKTGFAQWGSSCRCRAVGWRSFVPERRSGIHGRCGTWSACPSPHRQSLYCHLVPLPKPISKKLKLKFEKINSQFLCEIGQYFEGNRPILKD